MELDRSDCEKFGKDLTKLVFAFATISIFKDLDYNPVQEAILGLSTIYATVQSTPFALHYFK